MAKKDPVPFVRARDFETIDDELTDAMLHLDEANCRVLEFLAVEGHDADADKGLPPLGLAEAPGAPEAKGTAEPSDEVQEQATAPEEPR